MFSLLSKVINPEFLSHTPPVAKMAPDYVSKTSEEMLKTLVEAPLLNRPCTIGLVIQAKQGDDVDVYLQKMFAKEMETIGRRLGKRIELDRGIVEYEIGNLTYVAYVDDGTESSENLERIRSFGKRLAMQGNPRERTFIWILSNESRLRTKPYIESLHKVAYLAGLRGEYIPVSWQMLAGPLFVNLIDSKSRPETNEKERINSIVEAIISCISRMTKKDFNELNNTLGEMLRSADIGQLDDLFNGVDFVLHLPDIEPISHTIEEFREADKQIRTAA